jgi:hypothetical protein
MVMKLLLSSLCKRHSTAAQLMRAWHTCGHHKYGILCKALHRRNSGTRLARRLCGCNTMVATHCR